MPATRCRGDKLVDVFGQDEHGQDLSHPVDKVLTQKPGVVVLDQATQPSVPGGANDHATSVRLHRSHGKQRIVHGDPWHRPRWQSRDRDAIRREIPVDFG